MRWDLFWIGVAFLIGLMGAVCLGSVLAMAHSWYPMECCHEMDCAPAKVEIVRPMAAGMSLSPLPTAMLVTTPHGSIIVPADFKSKDSPDGQAHACILNGKLICLWLPPAM